MVKKHIITMHCDRGNCDELSFFHEHLSFVADLFLIYKGSSISKAVGKQIQSC